MLVPRGACPGDQSRPCRYPGAFPVRRAPVPPVRRSGRVTVPRTVRWNGDKEKARCRSERPRPNDPPSREAPRVQGDRPKAARTGPQNTRGLGGRRRGGGAPRSVLPGGPPGRCRGRGEAAPTPATNGSGCGCCAAHGPCAPGRAAPVHWTRCADAAPGPSTGSPGRCGARPRVRPGPADRCGRRSGNASPAACTRAPSPPSRRDPRAPEWVRPGANPSAQGAWLRGPRPRSAEKHDGGCRVSLPAWSPAPGRRRGPSERTCGSAPGGR